VDRLVFRILLDSPSGDQTISYFTIALSPEMYERAPLAFHKALRNEVKYALQDMTPLVTEAAYRGFEILAAQEREAHGE
jgi:hypothetical protein